MHSHHPGPLEVLTSEECHRLLATATLGRLAFTDGALPAVVPVHYAAHDGWFYIPARRGGMLATGVRGAVVALQVDSYRDALGPGWSVTAVGPSSVLSERSQARTASLGLLDGASGDACLIGLRPGLVRGWRIGDPPPTVTGGAVSAP